MVPRHEILLDEDIIHRILISRPPAPKTQQIISLSLPPNLPIPMLLAKNTPLPSVQIRVVPFMETRIRLAATFTRMLQKANPLGLSPTLFSRDPVALAPLFAMFDGLKACSPLYEASKSDMISTRIDTDVTASSTSPFLSVPQRTFS